VYTLVNLYARGKYEEIPAVVREFVLEKGE
jgi:hypothetical protein